MGQRNRHRSIGRVMAAAAAAAAAAAGLAGLGGSPADAGLMVDFRAVTINGQTALVTDPKSVPLVTTGDVVGIEIYARIQGTNAANDEAFHNFTGSIQSSSGGLLGNLSNSATVAPFNASGSQNGSQQDFDSDGDLDIGSIPNGARPATNSLYFVPRSAAAVMDGTPVPGANPAAEDWLVGTVNFTVTGSEGFTAINFVRRTFPNGANDAATSSWNEDGGIGSGTSPYSSNPLLIGVPEPSGLALAALTSLGLIARRKRRALRLDVVVDDAVVAAVDDAVDRPCRCA
jgi:hypothetical protein